ncbi:MAG: DUF4184 family protein [Pseudomonadota bacterium]
MPFTLCHPAIVLPLHARARVLTSLPALVIGSMAPDFVYFLPVGANGHFTHSVPGIFMYCLPASLLVYCIYHGLLREAFVDWAPPVISRRMPPATPWRERRPGRWGIVLLSLVIGAASHIAWDGFTHPNTILVRHLDVLRMPVFSLGGHPVPLFKLLQQLSSLVGFLVIAAYVRHWIRTTEPGPLPRKHLSARQGVYVVMGVAMSAVAGGAAGVLLRPARTGEHALFNAVVTAMAMAGLAILLFCVVRKIAALRGSPRRCTETESGRDEPAA